MAAAFPDFRAHSKVYTNENVQDIICEVIKIRPSIAEDLCKCLFKAFFANIYRDDNYIICYNFCQKYKDYFAIVGAKRPNHILFTAFFFQDWINFYWQ